ncbi:MAG: adenine phosphoribosyltransferase [Myxococcota bacterium]
MNELEFLLSKVRDVPDFPKPGIVFKDITPLLQDPKALRVACEALGRPFRNDGVTLVVGIESRGFLFGPSVATALDAGFAPARKGGKLPWKTVTETYDLEYGTDRVEMHEDAVRAGDQVLIVDDLIATGGTAAATVNLVKRMGGKVLGVSFLLELSFLEGRKRLAGLDVHSVLSI